MLKTVSYPNKLNQTFINLLLIFLPLLSSAQNIDSTSTLWGLKTHWGFIIPHSEELKEIANTSPWGVQLDWSKLNLTQKAWDQCNCYAKVGLSFNYFNYGNPDVLGNSYNLILFGEPYLTFRRNLFFTLRAGIGVTYLDQVYDEATNPVNTFYSSPISFIVLLNLGINYKLSPEWEVNLTAHYNHISNGGIRYPNRGMNFPTVSLGVDYTLNALPLQKKNKVEMKKGVFQGYGRLFATRKTIKATEDYPKARGGLIGIAGGTQVMIANFNALSTGVDFFRDNTLSVQSDRMGMEINPYVLGWAVGHHFIFGKFSFNQQMIYYLYKPFRFTPHKFYQRYELAYRLNDFLLAGISLRTHAHVAENFDIRLGVIF